MKYKKERGFGLITLVIVIAISAMIAAGAGMTTIQIIKGTERNEDHIQAIRQAQNLGRWFSRDAMMSENITAGDDTGTSDVELLTSYWKDWENGDTFNVHYLCFDDVDSLMQIKRTLITRDKDGAITENITTLVAFGIYSANLSQQDDTWIMSVEARSGQKNAVQEYRVTERLN